MSYDVLIFLIEGEFYAIDIERVRKIIEPKEIKPLSNSGAFVKGVISYEERALKVIELALLLNHKADTGCKKAIIYSESQNTLGLCVEGVDRITLLHEEELKKESKSLDSNSEYVTFGGVFERDGKLVTLIEKIQSDALMEG